MTREQLRVIFPNATDAFLVANAQVPDAESSQQTRTLDKDDARKAQSSGCPHVCFTLCRVRLLDIDAKYGSIKDLLDFLATCGIIPGDREDQITLEVNQVKVASFKEEETVIEVFQC